MPMNVAQEVVDFVCQVIKLGHWIRKQRPADVSILDCLCNHSMSPSQARWRFHPSNFNKSWSQCPGRAVYKVVPACQLVHPTNPEENWCSEPVWLVRLIKQKRHTAWWIGFYDPSQVCRLLFMPEFCVLTMKDLLEYFVNLGA
jgi:hypothetical protein